MRIGSRTYRVDWVHLAVATGMAALIVAYLLNARSTSLDIQNLLLVQPTALFALLMYLLILPQCFHPRDEGLEEDEEERMSRGEIIRVASLTAALGVFVFSLEPVGFDVAIFVFTAVAMFICGERRVIPLILYPLATTLLILYGFRTLMPYPMPTAFF